MRFASGLLMAEPLIKDLPPMRHMPTRVAVPMTGRRLTASFLYASHAREMIGTIILRTGRGIQRAVTQLKATVA